MYCCHPEERSDEGPALVSRSSNGVHKSRSFVADAPQDDNVISASRLVRDVRMLDTICHVRTAVDMTNRRRDHLLVPGPTQLPLGPAITVRYGSYGFERSLDGYDRSRDLIR